VWRVVRKKRTGLGVVGEKKTRGAWEVNAGRRRELVGEGDEYDIGGSTSYEVTRLRLS
jgi:hypothetical protein